MEIRHMGEKEFPVSFFSDFVSHDADILQTDVGSQPV